MYLTNPAEIRQDSLYPQSLGCVSRSTTCWRARRFTPALAKALADATEALSSASHPARTRPASALFMREAFEANCYVSDTMTVASPGLLNEYRRRS